MARPVSVNIPHALGKDEARRRIEQGFANIQQQLGGSFMGVAASCSSRWEAERLHFEGGVMGQRITGRLEVLPDSVQMQIDVPELLATIADRIKSVLTTGTQRLLQK